MSLPEHPGRTTIVPPVSLQRVFEVQVLLFVPHWPAGTPQQTCPAPQPVYPTTLPPPEVQALEVVQDEP